MEPSLTFVIDDALISLTFTDLLCDFCHKYIMRSLSGPIIEDGDVDVVKVGYFCDSCNVAKWRF